MRGGRSQAKQMIGRKTNEILGRKAGVNERRVVGEAGRCVPVNRVTPHEIEEPWPTCFRTEAPFLNDRAGFPKSSRCGVVLRSNRRINVAGSIISRTTDAPLGNTYVASRDTFTRRGRRRRVVAIGPCTKAHGT